MKNYFKLLFLLTGFFTFVFMGTSCDPDTNTGNPTEREIIEITDDITSATTWSGKNLYVINKYDFTVESTLTIEEGAIIKFNTSALNISVLGNGKIIANGTSSNPIIFTSYYDDANGGKVSTDQSATTPKAGDWNTIELRAVQGSEFSYCKFLYGGKNNLGRSAPTLSLTSDAYATINNCTFAYNGGVMDNSTYVGALHAAGAGSNSIIRNNIFYDNVLPLTINCNINLDNSNSFTKNGTNVMNGIFVSGVNINNNIEWKEDEVAFVLTSTTTNIPSGKTLTLGDNVVLKFIKNGVLNLGAGANSLRNYNGEGVWFTSIKDDNLKGDTNGDGSSSSPATADWTGIFLDESAKNIGYADWTNIKYNDPNAIVK